MSHNATIHDNAFTTFESMWDPASETGRAMAALGVTPTTLSPLQRQALDEQGFLLFPGHMAPELLKLLRAAHDRLMARKYAAFAGEVATDDHGDFWHHERGTRRLADLVSEDPVFDQLYTDPRLLAAVWAVLGRPFKLNSINAREALPGGGHQQLHRDAPRRSDGQEPGVNSAWILDDFTADSGPTRIIPGSNLWTEGPEAARDRPPGHYREQLMIAPAGSVLVFRNTLWHGGSSNGTARGRRVVHVSFSGREDDLGEREQRHRIRKSVWERITPAARWVLNCT